MFLLMVIWEKCPAATCSDCIDVLCYACSMFSAVGAFKQKG